MSLYKNTNFLRWIIIGTSFIIISLILWNTYTFFQHFKNEERTKMQNWSYAVGSLQNPLSDGSEIEVTSRIIESNTSTPMMIVDPSNKITSIRNIDTLKKRNPKIYLNKLKLKFEKENNPIPIIYKNETLSVIYYGNSPLLNKLKYYPLALLLIILLFGAVVYFFYRSSKVASQNKLWSGMAKETAHQIGTPLSSLIGWTEILKSENVNPDHIKEIEKDVERLQTITDRFSKIGSIPTLKKMDIVKATKESFDYIKSRSSKHIDFEFKAPNTAINVNLNPQLYIWTIENLVKNAIDAMKGKGQLKIEIIPNGNLVNIRVSDSGKGIPKQFYKKIFETGYTSKKRGWGLGLSLAKRIIEDYHNGKIKVLSSEIDKGTTIQISLKPS
ncbi:MAG: HAMP domain-containing histidine kinase [Flavobacteriaceae bacterium]|nr:HAMP domain-containing histidine kinase [Flavobacteriaceae bacterium]